MGVGRLGSEFSELGRDLMGVFVGIADVAMARVLGEERWDLDCDFRLN